MGKDAPLGGEDNEGLLPWERYLDVPHVGRMGNVKVIVGSEGWQQVVLSVKLL